MLKRYHIIALDDLRWAVERGSTYTDTASDRRVITAGTRRVGPFRACVVELYECQPTDS